MLPVAMIVGVVVVVVVVVVVMVTVVGVLIRCRSSKPQVLTAINPFVSDQDGPEAVISAYKSDKRVFVSYSAQSTLEEKGSVLQHLIHRLRSYHGIHASSHDFLVQRGVLAYTLEEEICHSSAVLCVCNKAFYDEWNGNIPPPQASTVAYIKSLLAADLQCGKDISKYAVVLLKKRDVQYIPTHYLSSCKQFNIMDTDSIVRFVKSDDCTSDI